MNKKIASCFASAVLGISAAWAGTFEGIVTYKVLESPQPLFETLKYYMKDSKMKSVIKMKDGSVLTQLVDYDKGEIYMLLPSMKSYTVQKLDKVWKTADKLGGKEDMSQFKKTGKKENIAGMLCEKWVFEDERANYEYWVKTGFGRFMQGDSNSKEKMPQWVQKMMKEEAFPMRMVDKNKKTKDVIKIEATKVEKKTLRNSEFKIPKGYKEMPTMMGAPMPGDMPQDMPPDVKKQMEEMLKSLGNQGNK